MARQCASAVTFESMGKSRERTRNQSATVNWLKESDASASRLRRTPSWLDYSCFMLARYPKLQPLRPRSKDPRARFHYESGRQAFNQMCSEMEADIAASEGASHTLEGLNGKRRKQLAALTLDTITEIELSKGEAALSKRLTSLAREAPRRQRNLARRIAIARKSLTSLVDYASPLDPWLGKKAELAAKDCLRVLDQLPEPEASGSWQKHRQAFIKSKFPLDTDKPADSAMAQLYCFFRYGCDLTGDESEVRTALIRNAFWTRWVARVPFRACYTDAESKGCSAVQQAVLRFSRDQGTTS